MERADTRKTIILPLLLTVLLGAFLRLYGITEQPPLSDEVGVAFSAVHYMEGGQFGPTMWYHPNLRNIVIYAVGGLFGWGPYALRGMSLLAGILSIPLTGILVYSLTKDRAVSALSAFLISFEQVHITFSRQAIQETWTTFFFLVGIVTALAYYEKDREHFMIFSGIAFGLSIASKHHGLPPLGLMLALGLYDSWKKRSIQRGVFIFSCLIFLPAIMYLLTYIPWFARGYDIGEWIYMQKALFHKMVTHTGNPMDQMIDTEAWQWFLRPMGYANFIFFDGKPFVTLAFSNPFVWLMVLPSAIYVLYRLIRHSPISGGSRGMLVLFCLFTVSYLPLAFSSRPIWLLSSLAVLPFAFGLVSFSLIGFAGALKWGRTALWVYMAVVVAGSLFLYPMATGKAKFYGHLGSIVERYRPPFEKPPL